MNFANQLAYKTSNVDVSSYLFQFEQKDSSDSNSLYEGWLSLAAEPASENTTDYFVAGTINIDEQIYNNGFSDLASLPTTTIINPYLQFPLANLTLGSPNIQASSVFFASFEEGVWLTPMTQGIHLPGSIYAYMRTNFFTWICTEVANFEAYDTDYFELSQTYLALDEC